MRISVVLPAPFGPRMAKIMPRGTVRSMPSTARKLPKDLTMLARGNRRLRGRKADRFPVWERSFMAVVPAVSLIDYCGKRSHIGSRAVSEPPSTNPTISTDTSEMIHCFQAACTCTGRGWLFLPSRSASLKVSASNVSVGLAWPEVGKTEALAT